MKFLIIVWTLLPVIFGDETAENKKEPVSLDDFLTNRLAARPWNASWINDYTLTYRDMYGSIYKYNVITRESQKVLGAFWMNAFPEGTITFSADEKFILISYNTKNIFRHSTRAQYAVYSIVQSFFYDVHFTKFLQRVIFAPTGHSLVYVYENNIYYLKRPQDSANPIRLTNSGIRNVLYCGISDWVYEEEVFGDKPAMWFSPDAKRLIFAMFDDRNVHNMTFLLYGKSGVLNDQYPKPITIKYPKAGAKNPIVTLYLEDLTNLETISVVLPLEASASTNDFILYGVKWITSFEFVIIWTNRVQNRQQILRCNLLGLCVMEDSYFRVDGWVDVIMPTYSKDGKRRLDINPQPEGDDTYSHLSLVDIQSNSNKRLTSGTRTVIKVYTWDENNMNIYYASSTEEAPNEQHVFVVNTITGFDKCLTCNFVELGESCSYASAEFSKNNMYYAKICLGSGPTYIDIVKTTDEKEKFLWEANNELRELLKTKLMPKKKDVKVIIHDGFTARVRMLFPPDLNQTSTKKYPAIIHVYAGPNSNEISDEYMPGFENYIVTSRKYIYIFIDGSGSGRDGCNKLYQVYRRLGTVEIDDQLQALRGLFDNFAYIDANNTGIWGWSYGGFAALSALEKDNNNLLKFAVAVAPVTNLMYYDSIYTERYMGLPTLKDNLLNYLTADLARNVDALRGKSLMIIHGNADDNVHYQQSMALVRALELADIPFRQQSYPEENHFLMHVSKHLYHTIDRFFEENFADSYRNLTANG